MIFEKVRARTNFLPVLTFCATIDSKSTDKQFDNINATAW